MRIVATVAPFASADPALFMARNSSRRANSVLAKPTRLWGNVTTNLATDEWPAVFGSAKCDPSNEII